VEITPDVIAAAAAGDVAQLLTLFAEEVKPEPEELVALAATANHPIVKCPRPKSSARTRAPGALTKLHAVTPSVYRS
jgi:hypothetical protein